MRPRRCSRAKTAFLFRKRRFTLALKRRRCKPLIGRAIPNPHIENNQNRFQMLQRIQRAKFLLAERRRYESPRFLFAARSRATSVSYSRILGFVLTLSRFRKIVDPQCQKIGAQGVQREGPHEECCVCRKPCHSLRRSVRALRRPTSWSRERPIQRTFSIMVWATICSGSVRLRKSTRTTSRSWCRCGTTASTMTEARNRSLLSTTACSTSPTTPPPWRSRQRPASSCGRRRSSIRPRCRASSVAASSIAGRDLHGKLFRTTLDAHVQALDAKTGKQIWKTKAADFKEGYSMTVAPLVADGMVITGMSGAEFGTRGFIDG